MELGLSDKVKRFISALLLVVLPLLILLIGVIYTFINTDVEIGCKNNLKNI